VRAIGGSRRMARTCGLRRKENLARVGEPQGYRHTSIGRVGPVTARWQRSAGARRSPTRRRGQAGRWPTSAAAWAGRRSGTRRPTPTRRSTATTWTCRR